MSLLPKCIRICILKLELAKRQLVKITGNTHSNKLIIVHLDDVTDNHLVPELIHQLSITQHARQPVVYMAVATVPLLRQHAAHHHGDTD